MTFRLALIIVLSVLPATSRAADCVRITGDYDAMGRGATQLAIADDAQVRSICGSLKIVVRRRDDPQPNVDIYATYAEFDPAGNAAEQRYNEWVRQYPAKMNFTRPVEIPSYTTGVADTMTGLLYRSPKLLSALASGWVCCGAHGYHWDRTLNIDPNTGRDVPLGDLLRLTPVANYCWQQFSKIDPLAPERRAAFVEHYPLTEPFVDADLAVDIEAIPANRQWTTKEMLAAPLLSSTGWHVSGEGITIFYGELVGYWAGPFNCSLTHDVLREFKKPTSSF